MGHIVVICDSAPVRAGLEAVAAEPEFVGVQVIQTAPYSAPLNPIEERWSVMKAEMERTMAASFKEMVESETEDVGSCVEPDADGASAPLH